MSSFSVAGRAITRPEEDFLAFPSQARHLPILQERREHHLKEQEATFLSLSMQASKKRLRCVECLHCLPTAQGNAAEHSAASGAREREASQLHRARTRRCVSASGSGCREGQEGLRCSSSEWQVYAQQLQHLLCASFLSVAAESARLWVKVGVPSNSARDCSWICKQLEESAPASCQHAFWAAECATQTWRAFLKKDVNCFMTPQLFASRDVSLYTPPDRKRLP